jgi:hypothetical protein
MKPYAKNLYEAVLEAGAIRWVSANFRMARDPTEAVLLHLR